MTTIRNAAVTWVTEYGPGTRADVGCVFIKLTANGKDVFDAQPPVAEFLKFVERLKNDAADIRAVLAQSG